MSSWIGNPDGPPYFSCKGALFQDKGGPQVLEETDRIIRTMARVG